MLWVTSYSFGSEGGGAYLVNAETRVEASRLVKAHYAGLSDSHLHSAPRVGSESLDSYCRRTETDKEELLANVHVPELGQIESLWAGT